MKTIYFIATLFISTSFINFECDKNEPKQGDWLLNFNSLSGNLSKQLVECLNNTIVQRLLLDLATEPRNEEFIIEKIKNSNITLDQLLKFHLIKKNSGLYEINILLFTKSDQYTLRDLTESHAKILAYQILYHKTEIEGLVNKYKVPEVDQHAILFMILGCFSLDWDGLALTAEKGLRTTHKSPNRNPTIFAWEPTGITSKNLYCGSHNSIYGGIEFTSFGDHEAYPRIALPDIFWNPTLQNEEIKSKIKNLSDHVSISSIGKETGKILLSLRNGPMSIEELAVSADIEKERVNIIVELLSTLEYIAQKEDKFNLTIPVLSATDISLVRELRKIGLNEMEIWLNSEYPDLKKELSKLTPFRFGQKQEDFFYNVWHDIFGAANRILVESGLFADPYSKKYGGQGYIPLVFEASLYTKKM